MADAFAAHHHEVTEFSDADLDLVEYLVIAVPELGSIAGVAQALTSLVASLQIRILDLVAVVTDADGGYVVAEPEQTPGLADLQWVEGDVGGLLSDDDIAVASRALKRGHSALILVVEDRWAQKLSDAARAEGGRIVGGERIPRSRLELSATAGLRDLDDGRS
ncbi:MAG: DUF6325 family protein, partial [Brevundimonas sp.]